MELKDKLVIEWTTTETIDSEGRTRRHTTGNDAVTYIIERWYDHTDSHHFTKAGITSRANALLQLSDDTYPDWMKREVMRMGQGIYNRTEVTDWCNIISPQYCVHVSAQGGDMVAYTPSVEAGNADKQLVTPIGKFLRKYFLLMTDKYLADKVAAHNAELNATFELATTREKIRWTYTNMPGDGSCMRYQPSHWFTGDFDVHPSEVYCAPGMGVAYMEHDGKVRARAVVYANGDDKRYVRVYGSPILVKILERNGYRQASLLGCLLGKIALPNHTDCYVMPYLDGPGGDQSNNDCYVADTGEWMKVVNREAQRSSGVDYVAQAKNHSSAYVRVQLMPDSKWVSTFTGMEYDTFEHGAPHKYLTVSGGLGNIHANEVNAKFGGYRLLSTVVNGTLVKVVCPTNTRNFYAGGTYFMETDANRKHFGHVKIDCPYDSMFGIWYSNSRTAVDQTFKSWQVSDGTDLTHVFLADGTQKNMIASCVPKMADRKQYVKCAKHNGNDVYSHKDNPNLIRSEGGTRFVDGFHDGYTKCDISGCWYSDRAIKTTCMWGSRFRHGAPLTPEAALANVTYVKNWVGILASSAALPHQSLDGVVASISQQAASMLINQMGMCVPYLDQVSLLVDWKYSGFGGYTFEQIEKGIADIYAYFGNASITSEIVDCKKYVDMMAVHYKPVQDTLLALKDRLEREAAGQTTLETA